MVFSNFASLLVFHYQRFANLSNCLIGLVAGFNRVIPFSGEGKLSFKAF